MIANFRHSLGLTQVQLSEKIGVSNRTVSKWERGSGFPDVSLLEPLANALNTSVIKLMHGFNPIENVRVIGQGYEGNCRSLPTRGVYRIEILTPNSRRAITAPDAITAC